jgi:hypothetical protein
MDKLAIRGGPKAITRCEELDRVRRWPVYTEEEKRAVNEVLDSSNVYGVIDIFE